MKSVKIVSVLFLFALAVAACTKDPEAFIENKPPLVNAGNDSTFELSKSVQSIQLSGSASDTDGFVTAYLWSQVSGPSQAQIATPGAASTLVSDLVSGTYVFQLMAVDNDGATGLDFVAATVIAPKLVTVTLKPANNPNETGVSSLYPGNNNMMPELPTFFWTVNGTPVEGRILMKFDLTSVPAGASITSAKLSLYATPDPKNGNLQDAHYGSSNAVYIRRITTNWSTATLNWNNLPTITASKQVELPVTINAFQNQPDVDVTGMVQDMVAAGNYGMMMHLKTPVLYNIQNYASSKHADSTKHPKLVLEYMK